MKDKSKEKSAGLQIRRTASPQHAQLYDIAVQSASVAGKSVYTARAMLRLDVFEDGDTVYARRAENRSTTKQGKHGRVVPNPANDQITYYYTIAEDKQSTFEIRDMSGRILFSSVLSGGNSNYTLSVAKLSSGVYYYLSIIENTIVDQGKLVIIK